MIDRYALEEKLKILVGDYLKTENVILVDLRIRKQGRNTIVRILIDEPGGGITLDRCAYFNNGISQLLDQEDLIQDRYVLEVSSPGADRPLLSRDDFSRCLNRKIRIFFNQAQEGKVEISGIVISVSEDGVGLDSHGQILTIPFQQIRKAKQVI